MRDWQGWFNAQLARTVPRGARDIRESLRSLVLQRFDLRDAKAAGIHETPKFREDRRNFTHSVVLDRYIREKFAPVAVDEEAVERHYRGNDPGDSLGQIGWSVERRTEDNEGNEAREALGCVVCSWAKVRTGGRKGRGEKTRMARMT